MNTFPLLIASFPVLLQVLSTASFLLFNSKKFLNLSLISSYNFQIPEKTSLYFNKFSNLCNYIIDNNIRLAGEKLELFQNLKINVENLNIYYSQFQLFIALKFVCDLLLIVGFFYFIGKIFSMKHQISSQDQGFFLFVFFLKIFMYFTINEISEKIIECLKMDIPNHEAFLETEKETDSKSWWQKTWYWFQDPKFFTVKTLALVGAVACVSVFYYYRIEIWTFFSTISSKPDLNQLNLNTNEFFRLKDVAISRDICDCLIQGRFTTRQEINSFMQNHNADHSQALLYSLNQIIPQFKIVIDNLNTGTNEIVLVSKEQLGILQLNFIQMVSFLEALKLKAGSYFPRI